MIVFFVTERLAFESKVRLDCHVEKLRGLGIRLSYILNVPTSLLRVTPSGGPLPINPFEDERRIINRLANWLYFWTLWGPRFGEPSTRTIHVAKIESRFRCSSMRSPEFGF
jgi:hypothetical protein